MSVQTTEDMDTEGSEDFTVTVLPAGTDARIALKSGDEAGTATIVEGGADAVGGPRGATVAVAGMSDDDDRWEFVGGTTLTLTRRPRPVP